MVWEKQLSGGSGIDHYVKVKLTWFLKKSFHLCAAHERKETVRHISKVNFYVFTITGKMVEIKSLIKELEIDFNRARKGKPPLNNVEGNPKNNISP